MPKKKIPKDIKEQIDFLLKGAKIEFCHNDIWKELKRLEDKDYKKIIDNLLFFEFFLRDKKSLKDVNDEKKIKHLKNGYWEIKFTSQLRLGGFFKEEKFLAVILIKKKTNKWSKGDMSLLKKRISEKKD